MSDYLTASELADLVGCKPNQRTTMIRWLDNNGWIYAVDRSGLAKVARAYRDRKLGISEGKATSKYADAPNRPDFTLQPDFSKAR
jgi:hypothetical protein